MPGAGKVFTRPKATGHNTVTEQEAEGDSILGDGYSVNPITVYKKTFGRATNLSEQEIDFTDPAALQLVLNDLAKAYARQTEAYACSVLTSASLNTVSVASYDAAGIIAALYDASAEVVDGCDELPTHVFASVDQWAILGKACDEAGRPLFPSLAPQNAGGQQNAVSFNGNPLGLQLVVSNKFEAGTLIVGNPMGIELYEQRKGAIRVDKPDTLEVTLAWRGYFAAALMESAAFVKLVD